MLKLGEKIISKLYLGDKAISKAYLGEKLVFQAGKPLFLDYVIFDGKSWIDTGITYQTCTAKCGIKLENSGYRQFVGSWGEAPATYWAVDTSNKLELGGGIVLLNSNVTNYTDVVINVDRQTMYMSIEVGGESVARTGSTVYNVSYLLGNMNRSTYYGPIKGQVYYHQFYNADGVLIQDLRPCIDPKGIVCFYDMVTKKYFYNQGTGTLKAGGRFVTSILFDGASFINTGIAHQTCTVETTIRFDETGTRQLMGFGSSSAQYWGKPANSVIVEGVSGSNCTDKTDVVLNFNTDEAGVVKITRSADGKTIVGSNGASISNMPYIIGGLPLRSATDIGYWCTCEVWSNKTTINGVVIQDLRPYVDENNIACFKDVVTGDLFYNQGTGTLGYTE